MLIIPHLFSLVKYPAVSQILLIPFFIYGHECNDRVLKLFRIAVRTNTKNQLIMLAIQFKAFQDIRCVWHIRFDNIIRHLNNFRQLCHDGCRNIRVSFPNMLKLFIGNNNM